MAFSRTFWAVGCRIRSTKYPALGTDEHQGLGISVRTPPVHGQVSGQLVDQEGRRDERSQALLGLGVGLEREVPGKFLHGSCHDHGAAGEVDIAHP